MLWMKPTKIETVFQRDDIVGNKAKVQISKRVFKNRTCAYQGVRNVRFSENLACFVFFKHPF